MSRIGLPSIDRLTGMPSDVVAGLRLLPDIAASTKAMERHSKALERVAKALDRLSTLLERLLAGLDGLNGSIDTLQGAVEPMGRLAKRMPGQKKD